MRPVPDQGMVGTFAAWARIELPILSPRAAMGPEGGPRNWIPLGRLMRASGSSGFSEAWPLQRQATLSQHAFYSSVRFRVEGTVF